MKRESVASAAKRDEWAAGPVAIEGSLCKACGICIGLCPQDVLSKRADGVAAAERPGQCSACRVCELHCPEFAISVCGPRRRQRTRTDAEQD